MLIFLKLYHQEIMRLKRERKLSEAAKICGLNQATFYNYVNKRFSKFPIKLLVTLEKKGLIEVEQYYQNLVLYNKTHKTKKFEILSRRDAELFTRELR